MAGAVTEPAATEPGPPAADPVPFDLCGPLPGPGITVLEASAGTGKTFTIAALVTRLVAEGKAGLDAILAVTFTRMATAELRDRVRGRLVAAEECLGRVLDYDETPPADDRLGAFLAEGPAAVVRLRRQRLADAIAAFDEATITTTHGFCQLVLAGLGVAGRAGVGATLVEDAQDIVDEVVDDLYLRGFLLWGDIPFGREVAARLAREAVRNPATDLRPDPGGDAPGLQRRLAERARIEVARRLRDRQLLTYDDLLTQLRDALSDPEQGESVAATLRARYRVVLIDEFQDTDPVQWEVVQRAFGDGSTTLVLIGDAKQAIYAFRGADVYAYLDAASHADARLTLDDNWRMDAGLLQAYDALFDPLQVGHPQIPYRPVRAVEAHQQPGLVGLPVESPLRVRILHTTDGLVRRTKQGYAQKDAAIEWVATDLAGDVVGVLSSGGRVVAEDRPVAARDIAVLVRTNKQAITVYEALRAAGVAAVVGGGESVFSSPSALDWLRLIEALEQPAVQSRVAAVALTPWFGMGADEVAGASDAVWERVQARLYRWADVLRRRGVAALTHQVFIEERLPGRLLAGARGERQLTDLGHVAQLLHAEGSAGQLGVSALRGWLSGRILEADVETAEADERSRRLDSDADAVQVLTIHRSKGLEFPLVYLPYLWEAGQSPGRGQPVVCHDPTDGNRRILDVGVAATGGGYDDHLAAGRDEQRAEDLRLMYVAFTRACNQSVAWWVRGHHCELSPLGRLLMFRHPDGSVPASPAYAPRDRDVEAALDERAARAPGGISVERCGPLSPARWQSPVTASAQLEVASWDRRLDPHWRRASYTSIIAGVHGDQVGSEPEEPGVRDEPQVAGIDAGPGGPAVAGDGVVEGDAVPAAGAAPAGGAVVAGDAVPAVGPGASPADRGLADEGLGEAALRAVPAGLVAVASSAQVGTFVHAVLEHVDFADPDLGAALTQAIAARRMLQPLGIDSWAELAAGLEAAVRTPLGPLAGGRALRDILLGDRLDELGFELPLVGGDQPAGEVLMGDVAALLARHIQPGGPLHGYPAKLQNPALGSHLRGYLTGSLDLVTRMRTEEGTSRFVVVDYKTNWVVPDGQAPSAWHYRPAALDEEMQRAHYPLQAVLYLVALHRYLRWRLPDYDPSVHLGGVFYLFIRGMVGPDAPTVAGLPCGVFAWSPPAALVTGLSDLLDQGSR
jgi:exodeoxyribonuclease V beta subunit